MKCSLNLQTQQTCQLVYIRYICSMHLFTKLWKQNNFKCQNCSASSAKKSLDSIFRLQKRPILIFVVSSIHPESRSVSVQKVKPRPTKTPHKRSTLVSFSCLNNILYSETKICIKRVKSQQLIFTCPAAAAENSHAFCLCSLQLHRCHF